MMFYDPTAEHLTKLSGPWCCSYSGGKDSTSVVTVIEYWRRSGWLTVEKPQLVRSDTLVEERNLMAVTEEMESLLADSGWEIGNVEPDPHERLYCQILGRGLPPVHPGVRLMRWCTRSTKVDPMKRWKKSYSGGLFVTGLRLGESAMRDGKLKKSSCAAGGECGIPLPSPDTYSPILKWSLCQVVDWLSGQVRSDVRSLMADVFAVTKKLLDIYDVRIENGFEFADPEVKASRFGCIGCPAIGADSIAPASVVRRNGKGSPLNELYDVWDEARKHRNRLWRHKAGRDGRGPIKIEARKHLFARVMDIQRRAGVVLITPEDEAFIRDCWARKVYPRGWSEADELVEQPELPLFTQCQ